MPQPLTKIDTSSIPGIYQMNKPEHYGKAPISPQIMMIDTSITPDIYQTDTPEYFGKYCIDFYPDTLPTIAGFDTLDDVKNKIIGMFGKELFDKWFPSGININC